MKTFFKKLFFPFIFLWKIRDEKIKKQVAKVTEDYEALIEQYRLIELRQSKLSFKERKMVKAKIVYLIGKGHIKVGPEKRTEAVMEVVK